MLTMATATKRMLPTRTNNLLTYRNIFRGIGGQDHRPISGSHPSHGQHRTNKQLLDSNNIQQHTGVVGSSS